MLDRARQWFHDLVHGTSPRRRHVILKLLATRPSYEFELVDRSEGKLKRSVLCLELGDLEDAGLVRQSDEDGRYQITDAGRELLEASGSE